MSCPSREQPCVSETSVGAPLTATSVLDRELADKTAAHDSLAKENEASKATITDLEKKIEAQRTESEGTSAQLRQDVAEKDGAIAQLQQDLGKRRHSLVRRRLDPFELSLCLLLWRRNRGCEHSK